MSSAWAVAWFAHLADGAEPFVLTATDGDGVAGILALVRRRQGPLRTLHPVGMDPGDYWDVLTRREGRAAVVRALVDGLWERRAAWDAWLLRCPPPTSPVVAALDASRLRSMVRPGIPDPVVELPESFDAYLATLGSNRRSNLRKHLRRLDAGEIELREVGHGPELDVALRRWQAFRRAQWDTKDAAINPAHLDPRLAEFVAAAVRGGTGMVWEFDVAGAVAGTYVNFADADAFHWWLGGFDPVHARLGLGKVAIGHGIRTSIEAGRARFDFGRGAEPYKYWYGARDRLLDGRVVLSGTPRSRLAEVAARAALARPHLMERRAAARRPA